MAEKKATRKVDDEAAVLEKIAAMPDAYRTMAQRMHEIIMKSSPELKPRVWYGMPGYAKSKTTPVICFFRVDEYMTFGLTEKAHFALDKGAEHQLMECAWFFRKLDKATEAKITEIVRKAAS